MKNTHYLLSALMLSGSVTAGEPISEKSGFSGIAILGGTSTTYSSSEIAESRDNKLISNHSSPESVTQNSVLKAAGLAYTTEDLKTEFFIGRDEIDILRFDSSFSLGVRHQFDGFGIIGASLLSNVIVTEVWQDPLLTGQKRKATDRSSAGLSLKWEGIMESSFDIEIQARKIDFDHDKNGFSQLGELSTSGQVINEADILSLRRNATYLSTELSYDFALSPSDFFTPSLELIRNDADGKARTFNAAKFELSYLHLGEKWIISPSLYAGQSMYSEKNPIFNKKQDTVYYGASLDVIYQQPFDLENWGVIGGISVSKGSSDIKFYDADVQSFNLGIMYNF